MVERLHREFRRHPRVDRVADDALGEDVLDHAGVELAFTRRVLRDIADPQLVDSTRAEVELDQVVVDGRTRSTIEAACPRFFE